MNISPSRVSKGQTCMMQVFFHYKLGIRSKITSANLAFGKAVDQTVMDYLESITTGSTMPPMEDVFVRHWKKESAIALEYSSTMNEKKLTDIGAAMVKDFPAAWEQSGLMVFVLPNGKPALQVSLKVRIPGTRDVLGGYLDLIAVNVDGEIIIIDVKTTGVAYDDIFVLQADQLTAYQILVDAHAQQLGVNGADKVGFMCLHKKAKPEIHQPQIVEKRSQDRVQDYLKTCRWFIDDYNRGRFTRSSLNAFNSPCKLCDFHGLCSSGCTDDLIIPDLAKRVLKIAA